MNLRNVLLATALAVATSAGAQTATVEKSAAAETQTYTADKTHANIAFMVKHLVISKVRGHFNDFEATLELDADNKLVSATATIQVASVDTSNEKRDAHLRGEDFFAVDEHPVMTFVSKSVATRDDTNVIVGDFTLHGVTKEIELPYELNGPINDPWGNTKIALQASTTVNRTEYGLTWNAALETGGVVVGEEVEISIDVEFAKQ